MNKFRFLLWTVGVLVLLMASATMAEINYETLQEGGTYHGFKVQCQYLNGQDRAIGARFLHLNTGFTLDVFTIQTVPQGFFWVQTAVTSDMGMPHTCEHLLLGKGGKGRYVAMLEDMSLGRSTAYTSNTYTSYSFSSMGGNESFFELFEAKLDALVHPTFSDEEIRREVCNVGVTIDPADGTLGLEEKGTVYTEMTSYYEHKWYHLFYPLAQLVYGPDHPIAHDAGGNPDDIRRMTPEDMWGFIGERYRLDNMGIIVAIPETIDVETCLTRLNAILRVVDTDGEHADRVPVDGAVPPAAPTLAPGEVRITTYPGTNEQEPGEIMFSWPAELDPDTRDMLMLRTFLNCFVRSQTSNLYNKFINSETRTTDLGASGVDGYVEDETGFAVYTGISDVKTEFLNEAQVASLAEMIRSEAAAIAAYAPGSPELTDFNNRARSYLIQWRKSNEAYLNSPPGFGNRGGSGGRWYALLKDLERRDTFQKSLLQKEEMEYALAQLDREENIWTDLIADWKLAEYRPYAVATRADPSMLTRTEEEKQKRLAEYTKMLKARYGVADQAEAIAAYKKEYDDSTAIIDAAAADIDMPGFLDQPPLSYDPDLVYRVDTIVGRMPLVSSEFGSMTSATVGLALDLHAIPEDKLIYVPLLPLLITEVGVVKDGKVIDYATYSELLKNEILGLSGNLSASPYTDRVELLVTGRGNSIEESRRALSWMQTGLFSPWLEPENLPRIRDVVTTQVSGLRNRMKGSEEYWVHSPAQGYQFQTNHLFLAASSFLTQEHFMHRLTWRLKEADGEEVAREVEALLLALSAAGRGKTRDDLVAFSSAFGKSDPAAMESGPFGEFVSLYLASSAESQDIAADAVADLAEIMPTIPEANAAADWDYLATQMKDDLLYRPTRALEDIKATLALVRQRHLARMYMISNADDRDRLMPSLVELAGSLNEAAVETRAEYSTSPVILERIRSRYPDVDRPVYAGLINTNTRNGVFFFSAPCADLETTDEGGLLDFLACKMYSGGGAHSMFMKTWSAGLAYSNGFGVGEQSGLIRYYAERCPDLSVTMRFVVDEMSRVKADPKLADYAIAQVFGSGRGPDSFESRGAAMAANLADGYTPEKVAAFRKRILQLRGGENLYQRLYDRLEGICGKVLIGYGPSLADVPGGSYFIIGPDSQFEKVTEYVASEEEARTIYKIYPRDYWMTD